METEDRATDRERRGPRGPELSVADVVRPRLHHVAPRRRRLLHAEAEVAQARLDEDRLAHPERGLDDEQRRAVVPEDVLGHDHARGQAQHVRRLDEALLAQELNLPAVIDAIAGAPVIATTSITVLKARPDARMTYQNKNRPRHPAARLP